MPQEKQPSFPPPKKPMDTGSKIFIMCLLAACTPVFILIAIMLWPVVLGSLIIYLLSRKYRFTLEHRILAGIMLVLMTIGGYALTYQIKVFNSERDARIRAEKDARAAEVYRKAEAEQKAKDAKVTPEERYRLALEALKQVDPERADYATQSSLLVQASEQSRLLEEYHPGYAKTKGLQQRVAALRSQLEKAEAKRQAKRDEEAQKAASDLEVVTWNWHWNSDIGYVYAEGQVKNISGLAIDNVQALVSYYDKDGNFMTADKALIEYDPLMPDQASPFKVSSRWNPAMKTAQITFVKLFGGEIPTYEKSR